MIDNLTVFICDKDALTEDPTASSDGILFYHPQKEKEETQALLCCHLLGMMSFAEGRNGRPASIIKLKHRKFTLRLLGSYVVGLGRPSTALDSSIVAELNSAVNLFLFYHGSLDVALEALGTVAERRLCLANMWDTIIAYALTPERHVRSAINMFSVLKLGHSGMALFMRSLFILEALQRRAGVLAGCMIFQNKVLCSQLDDKLTWRILFSRLGDSEAVLQGIDGDLTLPYGVRILRVHLSQDEFRETLLTAEKSPYYAGKRWSWTSDSDDVINSRCVHMTDARRNSAVSTASDRLSDNPSPSSNISISIGSAITSTPATNRHLSDVSDQSQSFSPRLYPLDPALHDDRWCHGNRSPLPVDRTGMSPGVRERREEDDSPLNGASTELPIHPDQVTNSPPCVSPCGDTLSHPKGDIGRGCRNEDEGIESEQSNHRREGKDDSLRTETSHCPGHSPLVQSSLFSSVNCGHTDIDGSPGKVTTGAVLYADVTGVESVRSRETMLPLHLYVQAHSNMVVALLLDPSPLHLDVKNLRPVWESILLHSSELEAEIQPLCDSSIAKDSSAASAFAVLDNASGFYQSNVHELTNGLDDTFADGIKMAHHQFSNDSTLTDVTLKCPLSSVYARRSHTIESFVQQRGGYVPQQGAPTPGDSAFVMDQRMKSILRKWQLANVLL